MIVQPLNLSVRVGSLAGREANGKQRMETMPKNPNSRPRKWSVDEQLAWMLKAGEILAEVEVSQKKRDERVKHLMYRPFAMLDELIADV